MYAKNLLNNMDILYSYHKYIQFCSKNIIEY